MNTTEISAAEATTLLNNHLQIWNLRDAESRVDLMRQTYDRSAWLVDPGVEIQGYEAIDSFIAQLQEGNQGYKFTAVALPEVHHNTALLSWRFGPAEKPDEITGHDVFAFHDGKVCLMHVYVTGATALKNA